VDGLDISRVEAVVAEGVAEEADYLEQRGFRDERVGPRCVEQCLFRDDSARLCDERGEDAERARRERDLDAVAPETVPGVELEGTERNPQSFRLSSANVQDARAGDPHCTHGRSASCLCFGPSPLMT
jgi:hypothetical protein